MSESDAPLGARGGARLAVLALLVLLPFFLRAHAVGHGLPRNYVPDTHIVRNALGMAATKNPVPRAGEFSTYPNLLPYCLLPLYVGWYAKGRLDGSWGGAEEFGLHLELHPEGAHSIARWLVLLFGTLTPLVVAAGARTAGLRSGALVAGFLAATSLLSVQMSTHERPWVPMSFFVALSSWAAMRAVTTGRPRALLLSAAAAALAFATHATGVLAFGLPVLAWLDWPVAWRGAALQKRIRLALSCAVLFALLALTIGYPHLVVHGAAEESAVIGGNAADFNVGGLSGVVEFRWATLARLSVVFAGYEPVLLVLGVAGLWPALRRRATRAPTLWTLAWSALFLTYTSDHVRYLLPAALGLAVPAGISAEWLLARRAGRPILVALLAVSLVQATRLSYLLGRSDTRASAEAALAELPPGSRVGIDRYGPDVDLSAAALGALAELRGLREMDLSRRERTRAEALAAGRADLVAPGIDAVHLGELFQFDERAGRYGPWPSIAPEGETPAATLRRLGVTHLLLVDRRTGEHGDSLLSDLASGCPTVWVIDPSPRGSTSEAFLPTEMDFPLTGLWTVDRPGPRLTLHELVAGRDE